MVPAESIQKQSENLPVAINQQPEMLPVVKPLPPHLVKRPVAFSEHGGDPESTLDCNAVAMIEHKGKEYIMAMPVDTMVLVCRNEDDSQPDAIVPIALHEELMDELFPVAQQAIDLTFNEDAVAMDRDDDDDDKDYEEDRINPAKNKHGVSFDFDKYPQILKQQNSGDRDENDKDMVVLKRTPQSLTLANFEQEKNASFMPEPDDDEDDAPKNGVPVLVLTSFRYKRTNYVIVRNAEPGLLLGRILHPKHSPYNCTILPQKEFDKLEALMENVELDEQTIEAMAAAQESSSAEESEPSSAAEEMKALDEALKAQRKLQEDNNLDPETMAKLQRQAYDELMASVHGGTDQTKKDQTKKNKNKTKKTSAQKKTKR